nr:MAG TPA: hypothetical protein [Bacteriophage sp.]
MNNNQIEKAIIKGIESKGQVDVGEEIAKAILTDNAQNNDFIDEKPTDKVADKAIETKNETNSTTSDDKESGADKQDNKHSFGKFKNPEELLKAYQELEKEFTKKSQKLSRLEAVVDDEKQGFDDESFKIAADKFFAQTPSAKPFAKDIALKIMQQPELKQDKNCLSVALVKVLVDKFRTPEQLMQDGQFLNDYVLCSSKVKDAIIGEYLKGLQQGQPPRTLSDGGMQCVTPSKKIKSIEEAGRMFLKNNE